MNMRELTLAALAVALAACSQQGNTPAAAANGADGAPAPGAADTPAAATAPAPGTTTAATPAGESTDVAATSATPSALERATPLPAAGNLPAGRWVAGKHYRPISPAQPTNVAPGKIEVAEVFWYGCPHCYALEPFISGWLKTEPPGAEFVRIPVMWNDVHKSHARMYYTLQALGALERLHLKVFQEVHDKKNYLVGNSDAASFQMQQAFATANGISAKDFAQAYESFSVQAKLQQAEDLLVRYRVDSVPLVIINGKYVTDVTMAEGQANLISLINDLVAAEKRR
jgi:thiol:disulfide interchange protein DsbA